MSKLVPSCVVKLTFTLPGVVKCHAEVSSGVNEDLCNVLLVLRRKCVRDDEERGSSVNDVSDDE